MSSLVRSATVLLALVLLSLPSLARAEDINGTWHFDYGYDMTFTGSGGTFSGFGGAGSSYTWSVSAGTISGNSVTWSEDYNEISYHVDREGTISGDSMSGTYTTSWGQVGNWSATRISGGGGGGGGGGVLGDKRPTSITLFCNRTGVGLNTAACTATVADAGAPPRISPSGSIQFVATGGFFPGKAECILTPTQFSPGISACDAQFAVPDGFPIAVKFPIEAAYPGNETFESSATSHDLIKAGCISTPGAPCPNSIGLSFEGYPRIVADKLALFVNCGQGGSAAANSGQVLAGESKSNPFCSVSGFYGLDVAEFLKSLSLADVQAMSAQIDEQSANKDALLKVLRDAYELNQERLQTLQQTQDAIFRLQEDILKDRVKVNAKLKTNFDAYIMDASPVRHPVSAARKRRKPVDRITSATVNVTLKKSSQKRIVFKSLKRLKNLSAVARRAGIAALPVKLKLKVKQKGVRGAGTIEQSFQVAVQ